MQILNQTQIAIHPYVKWYILLPSIIISIILISIGTYLADIAKHDLIGVTVAIIGVVSLFSSIAVPFLIEKNTNLYKYQVIFDSGHSFKDFKDQYDLIEVNGLIYTIQDKENN